MQSYRTADTAWSFVLRALERKEWLEEGKVESILEFLEDSGSVPEKLRQHVLKERDIQTLSRWLWLAARAKSIEDFILNMG